MRALDRKLLRDLWAIKEQGLAICLVMACGVATFVMSLSTLRSLQHTRAAYYERYRFADVFAQLKRAPNAVAARIAAIPGVARVQTRVVREVNLDVAGLDEPAIGRLISLPGHGPLALNDLFLRGGRLPEPNRPGEVVVSEPFALEHGLQPGDSVLAVVNGSKERLKIVGLALSPEYVYAIRPGELIPDNKRFGVFWMSYTELGPAFDMDGAFNDVALALMPGALEPEVIRRLDRLLAPYGGFGAYGRDDQTSHKFVSNEMQQLGTSAFITPSIFLAVAAFLLNVILSRQVQTQREQIAALKAFGYTRGEVGLHYLKFMLVLVLVGVGLGTAAGAWLGSVITQMYTQFFRFPVFYFALDPGVVLLAFAVTCGASLLGTLGSVTRAMRLPPAEAMRPEPPANYRPTFIERLGLQGLFSQTARMILRHLERQPVKSGIACLGIGLAVAVLVLGNFVVDAVDYLLEFQFFTAQRQNLTVSFVEPTSPRVLHELAHLPGVRHVEGFRSVPVRMRSAHRSRRLGVMGLGEDRRLFRLLDVEERPANLPGEGLVLSLKLAEVLGLKVGDTVSLEVLEGERPVREARVAGLINDYSDVSAYALRSGLHRLMREGDCYSGAFLLADSRYVGELYRTLKDTPRVATVTVKTAALESFTRVLNDNLLLMRAFNVVFASVIAFGVVYNSARISLAERGHELATLRVLGFTRAEISAILLGELAVLTVLALPLGMGLGYGFAAFMTWALQTETQRIPLVVAPSTYAFAAGVVVVATVLSGLLVRRRLDRLDLVAVLKARE